MSMNAGQNEGDRPEHPARLGSMHDDLCRDDQTSEEEKLTMIASGQPSGAKPEDGRISMSPVASLNLFARLG
jgi:hypothetical protein